jgi:hypothetical protein
MYAGLAPADLSCIDVVIERPTHLIVVKDALDDLFAPTDS